MLYASTSHVEECPDIGPACKDQPPPTPYYHHVKLLTAELDLDATYGVTSWLAAQVHFPLRLANVNPTYSELDGTPKSVPNDIHHHKETLFGPGDPWLMMRVGGAAGRLVTSATLGVTVPLGSTVPNPYVLGAEGKWHEHIQFGTGTVLPIVGLGLSYAMAPVIVSFSGLGFFSLYENSYGYKAPSRFLYTLRADLKLLDGKLVPYVAADLQHQTEELWSGQVGTEGSTVRADLLVGGGVAWVFSKPWTADAGVRAHVASFSNSATLDYPGVLQLGLSTSFDVGGKSTPLGPRAP
jgi:hypothetical protein